MDIANRISNYFSERQGERAMQWNGRWWIRSELASFAHRLDSQIQELGSDELAVGLVARNRPTHVAGLVALLADRRPISMLYAFQSASALAADLARLRLAIVLLDRRDWTAEVAAAASEAGTHTVLLDDCPEDPLELVRPAHRATSSSYHQLPGPGIEILSSGTTGAPKRIFHGVEMLFRSLESSFQDKTPDPSPSLVFWPLGGIGGNLQLASALIEERPFVLFEKFDVIELVDAIRRHRMKSVALTPTMLRMIYDANVPAENLGSLIAFFGGAGPLDPDLQDKVEARYGKPVIWALGATEFCGTAIAWTLDLHREFAARKRGSAGRPLPGCHVRVVDPDTQCVLAPGQVGRMEVRVDRMGPEWIKTTDLIMIDEDDFIFHCGRCDGAIVRGGFKVIPEKICEALRLHPAVAEAAVVGVPEERLGEVPVAVVELRAGASASTADLDRHLRDRLASPQIPVRYIVVDQMPCTASTKVDLRAVRELVSRALA